MIFLPIKEASKERGAVLALVVFSLFILGALSSTFAILGIRERQVTGKLVRFHQASSAADAGAYAPLVHWDVRKYNGLELGGHAVITGATADGTGSYVGSVTRLGARTFFVTAEGTSADATVRQRAGAIMELRALEIEVEAALSIRGPLDIAATVRVSGRDRNPNGWSCPSTAAGLPAIRYPTPDPEIQPWTGCAATSCLDGSPLWVTDSAKAYPEFGDLGGVTLADLKAIAHHSIGGGVITPHAIEANETCVTASASNWGNPFDQWGACGDHNPAVYSVGDLRVHAGHGQGILVVEGDLTVSGDFHYFGIVIVLGRFLSTGLGAKVTGAVFVTNDDFLPQSLGGMTRIQYSDCAVTRALAGSGRGVLIHERGWVDMY